MEKFHEPLFSLVNFRLEIEKGRSFLENIYLDLYPGEVLLIQGANGVGKSSLLQNILFTAKQHPRKIAWRAKKFAYLPQNYESFFHIPMTLQDIVDASPDNSSPFHGLTLQNFDTLWNHASGGEKQRTLLNCVFKDSHELIFLDEPTNHLDESSKKSLAEGLSSYIKNTNASLVIVSHDFQNYSSQSTVKSLNLDNHRVNHV